MARVKINVPGMKALRATDGVQSHLEGLAEKIAAAANASTKHEAKFLTGSRQGASRPQGRWRTSVVTGNAEAMVVNAKHNTLIKSMGAAGG